MRSTRIALVLLGLLLAHSAQAQERGRQPAGKQEPAPAPARDDAEPASFAGFAPVIITAPAIIESNETDAQAGRKTVVSDEQIRDLNAQDLGTALRRTPGVTISRYNPIGSFGGGEGGAVFIRGLGSSRPGSEIKTLVDGAPMYMSIWNHPLLDLLPIDPARSIEIYKSPQPHRFGNAVAIINIVPRRQQDEGHGTRLHTAAGSFNTFVGAAEHGYRDGALDCLAGGAYRRSDGHRDDADGRMANGYVNVGYALAEQWDLRLFTLASDNRAKDPGPRGAPPAQKQGTYDTQAWLTTLTLAHDLERARGMVKLYATVGEGDWLHQPTTTPGVTEDLFNDFLFLGCKLRETVEPWAGGEVVGGVDLDYTQGDYDEKMSDGTRDRWPSHDFTILSPYLCVSHRLGEEEGLHVTPSAGVRFYHNSDFDPEWAPHAGVVAGYADTECYANYARGVVYPGLEVAVLAEKVIPALGDSWKDLHAERVDHFEVGVRQAFGDTVVVDVSLFQDEGRDRYVIRVPPPPPPVFDNLETFTIRGIEAAVDVRPHPKLTLFAGGTYLDTNPSDLPYAPEWSVSLGLNWSFLDRFRLSVDGNYSASMFVSPQARRGGEENQEKVDSSILVNAKLSCRLTAAEAKVEWEVFVAGENLTDENYEYRPGYPMPGINGMIGTTLRF